MSTLVAILGPIAIIIAVCGTIWYHVERSIDSRPRYQYVEVSWTDGNGNQKTTEGWVDACYYPRGMTLALEWANEDGRTEIGQERIDSVERSEWVRMEEGESPPPDNWDPTLNEKK